MSDFNTELLQHNESSGGASFPVSMCANFHPYICSQSRVTNHSRVLIEKIFLNNIHDDLISGNIIISISDHYAHFLLFKNIKIQAEIWKNSTSSLKF